MVTGQVPSGVHFLGLGRQHVEKCMYTRTGPAPALVTGATRSGAASLLLGVDTVLVPTNQCSALTGSRRAPNSRSTQDLALVS